MWLCRQVGATSRGREVTGGRPVVVGVLCRVSREFAAVVCVRTSLFLLLSIDCVRFFK